MPSLHRARGFSLIEIMVVIAIVSIMAGALAPMALRQINTARAGATRARMSTLVEAMVGSPASGTHGYVGDLGRLPARLEDLNAANGLPTSTRGATGVAYGYAGPYAPGIPAGLDGTIVDGWNRPYRFDGNSARLTSDGADGLAGSADDLVVPPGPTPARATLLIRVLGAPANGDPARVMAATEASVLVSIADDGVYREQAASPPASTGVWRASDLHIGLHAVRARGEGDWSDATEVIDVVELRGGTRLLTLTLLEPAAAIAPVKEDSLSSDSPLVRELSQ